MIKKQFTLYLANKPGVLARITSRMAKSKVNIEGISVASSNEVGLVQVVVSNSTVARKLLKSLGVSFTEQSVSLLPLRNEPGSLSKVISHLASHKVNISYVYATACDCKNGCHSYAIISAPDLKRVEEAWQQD